ncbi:MAG: hypothetical protein NC037_04670 [Bacteroides sp.]|nr:hypothetical protein [Bacillota bacterium]MCM1393861.1 hypothetical protein [[Eubacterium] siraeum]MCM1455804.1 hypothetical protein [Bacteroides sp.]
MSKLKANNISPYVGLAQRANAILYGEDIIAERVKLAKVVLIDASATDKYKDRLKSKIKNCPVFVTDDLKTALHKDGVYAVAVTNDGLANAIIELLR